MLERDKAESSRKRGVEKKIGMRRRVEYRKRRIKMKEQKRKQRVENI